MVNPGAHNTIDAQRHVGRALPYGSQWRPQYCRGKCRRLQYYLCQDGCRVLFLQAYRVWSLVSWFDLCALACFLRLFPGPFRAGVPGRMALVDSGCASQRRAVSRVSTNSGRRRGVGVGSSAWPRPSDRRGHSEAAGVRSERSGRRGGLEVEKTGATPPRPDLLVGDWIALPAYCLDSWAGP